MIELGVVIGLLAVLLIAGALVYYDNAKMRRESEEYYRRYLKSRVDDDRTRVK